MPAYLIGNVDVVDPALYDDYRRQVLATVAAHGGRFLVRGGASEVLEGAWVPKRLVVIEFPSMAALKSWYASPAYRPLIELRNRAARSQVVLVEGAAAPV